MTENERMATMIACPWCEKPIEATKPHECARIDMAHLISKLRLRCEELEQKLAEQSRAFGYTRTKVMALDEENQRLRDYGDKVTAERDGLSLLRDHLEEEIGKFRTRCEKAEAQLATARNDALDEALGALDKVRAPIRARIKNAWSGSAHAESWRLWQARNLIEDLKTE